MRTRYDEKHGEDSNRAHMLARKILYPRMFGDDLVFENTLLQSGEREAALDGELAIDRVVGINSKGYRLPIKLTIQERFRKPHYHNRQDVTITAWNRDTQQPAELYKMAANLFVYGYHNADMTDFLEVVTFYTAPVWIALATGQITPIDDKDNNKNQNFVCVSFHDLYRVGAMFHHYRSGKDDFPVSIQSLLRNVERNKRSIALILGDLGEWVMGTALKNESDK